MQIKAWHALTLFLRSPPSFSCAAARRHDSVSVRSHSQWHPEVSAELSLEDARPRSECQRGHSFHGSRSVRTKVDGTNNAAERALRPAVVMRKITAGSRSERGAGAKAILMSVLRTARYPFYFSGVATVWNDSWAGASGCGPSPRITANWPVLSWPLFIRSRPLPSPNNPSTRPGIQWMSIMIGSGGGCRPAQRRQL